MNFNESFKYKREYFENELNKCFLNPDKYQKTIYNSMKYSLDAGGKRIRPILLIEACELCGGNKEDSLEFALAIEMIHTYSLIHDDLPAMDNDDFRRGKPTNHKVYGEGVAVLAGDGLLNTAYELMIAKALKNKSNSRYIDAMDVIAKAAGIHGMIGGQVIDLESEGKKIELQDLDYIHKNKTAALLTAPLLAGGHIASCSEKELKALYEYGQSIGLAFQIIDDILDVVGDQEKLGKDIGSDIENEKSTYVSIYGLEKSKKLAEELIVKSKVSLDVFGERATFLVDLAEFMLKRDF